MKKQKKNNIIIYNMLSIIILLLIIFIINITSEYTKSNIKLKKKIKYTYVPKSIYDYQYSEIELLNKYSNIFTNNYNIENKEYKKLSDEIFESINSNKNLTGNYKSSESNFL